MVDLQRVATRVRRRIDESWNTILSLKCKSSFYSRKTAGPWDADDIGRRRGTTRTRGRPEFGAPYRGACVQAPLFVSAQVRTCIK